MKIGYKGKDMDELEDLDFDFDSEFGVEPSSTDDRNPIVRNLAKFGRGITKDLYNEYDKEDSIKKAVASVLPSDTMRAIDTVGDIVSDGKEIVDDTVRQVTTKGYGVAQIIKNSMPKNRLGESITGFIDKHFKPEEIPEYVDKEAEERARQAKERDLAVISMLGEQLSTSDQRNALTKAVDQHLSETGVVITSKTLATLEMLLMDRARANTYYRNSLKLKWEILHSSKEQSHILKETSKMLSVMLTDIGKNTALPDMVKYKKSEMFKDSLVRNSIAQLQDAAFGEGSSFDRLKKRAIVKLKGASGSVIDSIGMAGDSSGVKWEALTGAEIGDRLRQAVGSRTRRAIGSTEKGNALLTGINRATHDTENLIRGLDKKGEGNFSDIINGFADLFNMDTTADNLVHKDSLTDIAVFDNMFKETVMSTIPKLLSEINSSINKLGGSASEELIYDYNKETLIGRSEVDELVKNTIDTNMLKPMSREVDKVLNLAGTGLTKEEINTLKDSLLKNNKEYTNIYSAKDSKFITELPEELRNKVINNINTNALDADGLMNQDNVNDFNSAMLNLRGLGHGSNLKLDDLLKGGGKEQLMKLGYLDYDSKNKSHSLNMDAINNTLSNLLDVDTRDAVVVEERPEDFLDKLSQGMKGFVDKSSEYLETKTKNISITNVIGNDINKGSTTKLPMSAEEKTVRNRALTTVRNNMNTPNIKSILDYLRDIDFTLDASKRTAMYKNLDIFLKGFGKSQTAKTLDSLFDKLNNFQYNKENNSDSLTPKDETVSSVIKEKKDDIKFVDKGLVNDLSTELQEVKVFKELDSLIETTNDTDVKNKLSSFKDRFLKTSSIETKNMLLEKITEVVKDIPNSSDILKSIRGRDEDLPTRMQDKKETNEDSLNEAANTDPTHFSDYNYEKDESYKDSLRYKLGLVKNKEEFLERLKLSYSIHKKVGTAIAAPITKTVKWLFKDGFKAGMAKIGNVLTLGIPKMVNKLFGGIDFAKGLKRIRTVMSSTAEFLKKGNELRKNLTESMSNLKTLPGRISESIKDKLGKAKDRVNGWRSQLAKKKEEAKDKLKDSFSGKMKKGTALKVAAGSIAAVGAALLYKRLKEWTTMAGKAWDQIGEYFKTAKKWLGDKFTKWADMTKKAWEQLGTYYKDAKEYLLAIPGKIVDGGKKMWDKSVKALNKFKDWISGKFTGIIDGVKDTFNSLKTSLGGFVDGITKPIRELADSITSLFGGVVDSVTETVTELKESTDKVVESAKSGLQDQFDKTAKFFGYGEDDEPATLSDVLAKQAEAAEKAREEAEERKAKKEKIATNREKATSYIRGLLNIPEPEAKRLQRTMSEIGGNDTTNYNSSTYVASNSNTLDTTVKIKKGLKLPKENIGGKGLTRLEKFVLNTENFASHPFWDYKQWTNGYGTKAKNSKEQITVEEAMNRFKKHLGKNITRVNKFVPKGTPDGIRDALASLSYNSGYKWMTAGLGKAIKRKDWGDAKGRFMQYTRAGGEVNKGLVKRRTVESSWFDDRRTTPRPDTSKGVDKPLVPKTTASTVKSIVPKPDITDNVFTQAKANMPKAESKEHLNILKNSDTTLDRIARSLEEQLQLTKVLVDKDTIVNVKTEPDSVGPVVSKEISSAKMDFNKKKSIDSKVDLTR